MQYLDICSKLGIDLFVEPPNVIEKGRSEIVLGTFKKKQVLFSDQQQIITRLEKTGYKDFQISLNTDGVDKCWEVSCKK